MTKARDLANLIGAGNPLSDGAISVAEISDLTASAAELNKLDGVTSSTTELNKLTGLTSSTTELNKLTGLTSSTADLNNVAGINSSVQTQLDAKASSASLGTASTLDVGTGANQVVQLNGSGQLPALNASNLTGIDGVSAAALLKYGAL